MTRDEAYSRITEYFASHPTVQEAYGLQDGKTFDEQFSPVSIERIMFNAVAECFSVLGQEQAQFLQDVDELLHRDKAHTPEWYARRAKQFRYGMELNTDGEYTDDNLTPEQVAQMQIVHYASAVETTDRSMLFVKVATADRTPLTHAQFTAFSHYMQQVTDAGVRFSVVNAPADLMRITLDIYYDALVLDASGKRLDGTADTPVQDIIREYLSNLPFNGRYTNVHLIDRLQAVDGVVVPELRSVESRSAHYSEFAPVGAFATAYAGYYSISDEDLILKFIPYA